MVVVGTAVGSLLLATLGLLIAGLSGASPVRVPGFPDSGRAVVDQQAPAAVPPPDPAEPGATVGPPEAVPTSDAENQNRRVPTQTPSHKPKPTKP